jgi:hypothetical protein
LFNEIKEEVVDVQVGQYDNGDWYATSNVPWLAAEDSSPGNVMKTIQRIAPALMGGLCLEVPFELKWRMEEMTK